MKRPGRGSLVILALFLASSAALRLGGIAGQAMAKSQPEGVEPAAESPPAECPLPPPALLQALKEREAQVNALDAASQERMAALALAEELQYVLSMVDELEPQPDTSSPSCYYSAEELEQERQALCRQLGISRWC